MRCRICAMDIKNAKYCFRCGWLAGVSELKTTEVKAGRSSRAPIELEFENRFEGNPTNADVELELFIPEDSRRLVSFDTPGAESRKYTIKADSTEKIKLYLNLDAHFGSKKLSFNIRAVSDDAAPDRHTKNFYRPYNAKQYRDVTYRIPIEILEPSRLVFSSHLLIFDNDSRIRKLLAKNSGLQEITLQQNQIVINDSGYKAFLKANCVRIPPGGREEITIELINYTGPGPIHTMSIMYQAQEQAIYTDILLMRRNSVSLIPDIIYEKVVAVDFGTRKTVAAYIDAAYEIERFGVTGELKPNVKLIPLEKTDKIINYEIPSSIAYNGREVLVGTAAEGSSGIAEIARSMKTQIRNDAIIFHKGNTVTSRDTREVITDFLKQVREAIINEFTDDEHIQYIFTLPVLDGDDENGALYEQQKRITLECVRRAGFCLPDEDFEYRIKTISEPEAAMCHIVNAIKNNRSRPQGVNLRPNDIICVFDYGGGTLDISFGRYKLVEGIPSVDAIANIGQYSDRAHPESGRFDLGGNRLDNNLALAICKSLPEGVILDEPEYDGHNNLIGAKGFNLISKLLNGVQWEFFKETLIKGQKEKLSEKWDELDRVIIEKDEYSELVLEKQTFKEVVYKDLYYAIDAMKEAMKNNGIGAEDLKYMFLVGGSSLIKIIKTRLETEFAPARIYNAFDFSQTEDYEKVKREAIYPVVNGAALSYLTRVTDVFDFDVIIAPVMFPDNAGFSIRYRRGDGFSAKQRSLSRRVAAGEWEITARLSDRLVKLGGFTVEPSDDIISIKIFTHFLGRKLRISYQRSRTEVTEVSDLDVSI